ncbi:MAG: hypothetical protein DYG89_41375 [Caldilinea sp. CFX5]|nr:hypothetical protein [Caldilinea sp. CFX5]
MSDQTHLVLFDADRIKDFVFATGRLKEIRGASQLVRDATDSDRLQQDLDLPATQIIFAEGGSGLLTAASKEEAEARCQALMANYRKITHGASLTAVCEPYTAETFQQAVQAAARKLQLAKEDRQVYWQTAHSPFTFPCASCGARPATHRYAVTTLGEEELCAACWAKRRQADTSRTRSDGFGDDIYLAQTDWGRQFLASLPAADYYRWAGAKLPENLSKLAELARPGNYLGFLYADGNGLGERLQQQTSAAGYRALSQRISSALRRALWQALQQHFPSPRSDDRAPFELIAVGGDDVILVVVADQVLPLAVTLGERFTAESRDVDSDDALTLSLGIVIAHPGQPILNLEQQARELLRRAKREHPGQPAIDFHIVTTPVLQSIDEIREQAYTHKLDQARLTSRPLLLTQLTRLLYHTWLFKQGGENGALPRNKLHALYQALAAGQDAAAFEAFFLRSRLNQVQQQKFDEFFQEFGITLKQGADQDAPLLPWGRQANQRFTPFGDLVELYEFVHANPLASTVAQAEASEEAHVTVQN